MTPLRARLSLLRQRIILTARWFLRPFYHLPIDDLKPQAVQNELAYLNDLNKKALETITTLSKALSQVDARLKLYEKNIPRMRDLRKQWEREQQKFRDSAGSESKEAHERHEHGILAEITT